MSVLRKKCSLIRLTKIPPVDRLIESPPPPQSSSPRVSLTQNQIVMARATDWTVPFQTQVVLRAQPPPTLPSLPDRTSAANARRESAVTDSCAETERDSVE